MGENNNGIEQPVEPMSRVESILREEDVQRPLSRIEDLLIKGGGGGGSTVTITPTLSTGTKIADYNIDGEDGALYAPQEDSDENVEQTEVSSGGTYEVLLAGSTGSTTKTERANKSSKLVFNPEYGAAKVSNPSESYSKSYIATDFMTQGATKLTTSWGTNDSDKQGVDISAGSTGGDVVLTGSGNTWDGTHTSLKAALAGGGYTEIIDTLDAGDTELILQDAAITTTATYDFFTDTFGVSPTEVEVETGQLTLTFDEQEADVSVKVRIS